MASPPASPKKLSKMTSTLKSTAEANSLIVKWGAHEIKGLDPKRAEAIGLQPVVKKIGYGSSSQELPSMLQHEGSIARYCRRTAELMLQSSEKSAISPYNIPRTSTLAAMIIAVATNRKDCCSVVRAIAFTLLYG